MTGDDKPAYTPHSTHRMPGWNQARAHGPGVRCRRCQVVDTHPDIVRPCISVDRITLADVRWHNISFSEIERIAREVAHDENGNPRPRFPEPGSIAYGVEPFAQPTRHERSTVRDAGSAAPEHTATDADAAGTPVSLTVTVAFCFGACVGLVIAAYVLAG